MSGQHSPHRSIACVWMSAGVLTYRLCDRDFDCDHCPLDAALRRRESARWEDWLPQTPSRYTPDFPEDRWYTTGHLWLQQIGRSGDGARLRCGLDMFAAAIMGRCRAMTQKCGNLRLEAGEIICELDFGLGAVPFRTPVEGAVSAWNTSLCEQPDLVVTSPYEAGWIAEMTTVDDLPVNDLLTAWAARGRSQFDLHRFRRHLAMQTLAGEEERLGPTMADGGEFVGDLRQLLGGTGYAQMVRELIH